MACLFSVLSTIQFAAEGMKIELLDLSAGVVLVCGGWGAFLLFFQAIVCVMRMNN